MPRMASRDQLRDWALRRYRSVSRPYRIPSSCRLGQLMSLRRFFASVYDTNVPSLVASLLSWRCLAASASYFPHAAINLRPPFVPVSTRTSASNAVAFEPPTTPNDRISLCTHSVHSSPSHSVLLAQYPHVCKNDYSALATARLSFGLALSPTKVSSCAISSQCSHADGRVFCAVPR